MLISINADATGKEISASIRALNESYRPCAACRERLLPRHQKAQTFPKRALALTHDRRFNRLRNVPSSPVTRAFSAQMGMSVNIEDLMEHRHADGRKAG